MVFLTTMSIDPKVSSVLMVGELLLNGNLQPVKGALPIAIKARKESFEGFILPKENVREAAGGQYIENLWRRK